MRFGQIFLREIKNRIHLKRYSNLATNVKENVKGESTSSAPESNSLKWQLASAVYLERFPIVGRPLMEVERKYLDLCVQAEAEQSLFSDFDLRARAEKVRSERRIKKLKEAKDSDEVKSTAEETTVDLEEKWTKELETFPIAPLLTDADKKNDRKSLQRCMSRKLFLLVQQQSEFLADAWTLPFTFNEPPETMRETAERCLKQCLGSTEHCRFYGNAPVGFFKSKYSKILQQRLNVEGLKVFFFKAHFVHNQFDLPKSTTLSEFKWLNHDEFKEFVSKDYKKAVSHFLYE